MLTPERIAELRRRAEEAYDAIGIEPETTRGTVRIKISDCFQLLDAHDAAKACERWKDLLRRYRTPDSMTFPEYTKLVAEIDEALTPSPQSEGERSEPNERA